MGRDIEGDVLNGRGHAFSSDGGFVLREDYELGDWDDGVVGLGSDEVFAPFWVLYSVFVSKVWETSRLQYSIIPLQCRRRSMLSSQSLRAYCNLLLHL